jgi:hypothetical protein
MVTVRQNTFQIGAEYLHLFVGRRAIIPVTADAGIPFLIQAVRYEPERHRVLVQIDTPMLQPVEAEFAPDEIIEVEHEQRAVAS